ncbi:type VII secretion protein EccB [Demequina sp.]|uniref:type VII secretion protein EccB n=1 Tax=Demequina sp. TaxID=2050685 RepID=UPI003A8A1FA8
MATKKDLIDAQTYSRKRLLAAFTSGAPGGKEVEPTSPLKAVIGGVVLSAMVILGGVFYGYMNQGLKPGWETNTLVITTDTGARYLSREGTLYPVVNATSARLLTPADQYSVVTTSAAEVKDAPVGPTIGIVGAPDDVPLASDLVPTGWSACAAPVGTAVSIPGDSSVQATDAGVAVVSDGAVYVIAGGYRYAVASVATDAVLRAMGLAEQAPVEVDSRWLNLFEEGAELAPLTVDQAGEPVGDSTLVVGAVVHPQGSTNRFLVTPEGELAAISPLAQQLYMLGTGALLGGEREVTAAEIRDLPTADTSPIPGDWPAVVLVPLSYDLTACALLVHGANGAAQTSLAATDVAPDSAGVNVAVRAGALVITGGRGAQSAQALALVDETGTSYAMPGADSAVLTRVGYSLDDATHVPSVWMQFFASGPALTVEAAGASPAGQSVSLGATPEPTPSSSLAIDSAGIQCDAETPTLIDQEPPSLAMLQSEAVWERATGAGVTVAVVDSGIAASNEHLQGVVTGGVNLVPDGEREDGLVDKHGHGTAIAGQIAAQRVDGSGVVGLAPDVELLSVRVYAGRDQQTLEAGWGPDSGRLAEGIRWAADNGADVINVSLSDEQDVPAVRDAVAYAQQRGALIVASAGNRETATVKDDVPRYPAAYDGVLAVTASDLRGTVTDASIHGEHVEIAAPGMAVVTATPGGGDCIYSSAEPSSSYATAYAAAAVALVKQAHPDDTNEQLRYRLMASAIRVDADARDDVNGWGLLQPLDAISLVPGSQERGPSNPFTGADAIAVSPASVQLAPVSVDDPLDDTRRLAIGVGVVGFIALAGLGSVLVFRRRADQAPVAQEPREGMLDRNRESATELLR